MSAWMSDDDETIVASLEQQARNAETAEEAAAAWQAVADFAFDL